MRFLKWLLLLAGALVLLLVVAAVALPIWFDPNDHRDRIVAAVEERTGRDFTLEGEIGWSVFPTLSVTTGPIRLGNDPAFPGPEFLAAEEVSAALDILPLLSGEVRIGQIRLTGVDVDLVVDRQGRGNWASLQERLASDDPPAAPSPETGSAFDVVIDGLALVDAGVTYRDLGTDFEATLSDLELEVAPVAAGRTTELSFATTYAAAGYGGQVAARVSADGLLGGAGPRFAIRQLEVSNEQGVPVEVTLGQGAILDLGDGTATLPTLDIRSGAARVQVNAEGRGLPDAPSFSGRLEVPDFALGDWLREQGLYAGETRSDDALQRFAFETDFSYADGQLSVDGLAGRLDDSTLTGAVTVGEVIRFDLVLDQLDVDRYLPPPTDDTPGAEPTPPAEIALGQLDGKLRVGRIVIAGLEATDIDVTVKADENGLRITPMTGALYGGALDASVSLRPAEGRAPAAVRLAVEGVEAGALLSAWMARPVMTGTGRLAVDLSLADAFAAAPLRGLNGDLSFHFEDGALYGVNVVGALRRALALAGRGDPAALAEGDRATDFSSFDVAGAVTDGVLRTSRFDLASPYLRVDGSGSVDLAAGTLAYRLEPVLLRSPDGATDDLGRLEGTRVPLQLSGALGSPSVEIDAAEALLSGQREKLKGKLAEKLGLEGEGNGEAGEGGSKDALRGLLRNALDRGDDKDEDDEGDGDGGG